MLYLDRYLEALQLLYELRPEVRNHFPEGWEIQQRECCLVWQSKRAVLSRMIDEQIKPLAEFYVEGRTQLADGVARACHLVADDFLRLYDSSPPTAELAKRMPINITVGDVRYRNRSVFQVTRESVLRAVQSGRDRPHEDLRVHVWLTAPDMTVIDLSVVDYLRSKGESVTESDSKGVLIWHESTQSNFSFEPILVWNDFCDHVEPDSEYRIPDFNAIDPQQVSVTSDTKIGRNDPCPCGSGRKYKKCCGATD